MQSYFLFFCTWLLLLPTLLPFLHSWPFLDWLICLCAYFVMHSHLCLLCSFEPCSDTLDHVPSAWLCSTYPLLSESATGCHTLLLQSFVGTFYSSNSGCLWVFSKFMICVMLVAPELQSDLKQGRNISPNCVLIDTQTKPMQLLGHVIHFLIC